MNKLKKLTVYNEEISKKRKFLANAKTGLYVTNIGKISLKNNQHCTIRFFKRK